MHCLPLRSNSVSRTAPSCSSTYDQQEHSESTILLLPFTAGRVLLAHSTYHSLPLHPTFEAITSLDDITCRWAGICDPASAEIPPNLASRFASRTAQAK